jgi:hypothetical protein
MSIEPETRRHDHDLDWPWTLYFNGEAVPRWANCWNLCELPESSRDLFVDYPWLADRQDFERLCNRMDLAHTVDSEDPVLFRILSLSLLVSLLRHEAAVRAALAPSAEAARVPVSIIFEGIRDGAAAMHTLTVRDQFSFWSVGYDDDQTRLAEAIRQSRRPPTHESYVAPPHVLERNRVATYRLHRLRCELLELIRAQRHPKSFRRFVHELPTCA